jgi:hypothetical protein
MSSSTLHGHMYPCLVLKLAIINLNGAKQNVRTADSERTKLREAAGRTGIYKASVGQHPG